MSKCLYLYDFIKTKKYAQGGRGGGGCQGLGGWRPKLFPQKKTVIPQKKRRIVERKKIKITPELVDIRDIYNH